MELLEQALDDGVLLANLSQEVFALAVMEEKQPEMKEKEERVK